MTNIRRLTHARALQRRRGYNGGSRGMFNGFSIYGYRRREVEY